MGAAWEEVVGLGVGVRAVEAEGWAEGDWEGVAGLGEEGDWGKGEGGAPTGVMEREGRAEGVQVAWEGRAREGREVGGMVAEGETGGMEGRVVVGGEGREGRERGVTEKGAQAEAKEEARVAEAVLLENERANSSSSNRRLSGYDEWQMWAAEMVKMGINRRHRE